MRNTTMMTDLYQLTMAAAYMDSGKDSEATFDMFIRKLPQDWGFFIANGIEAAIDYATNIEFTDEDLAFLGQSAGLSDRHLAKLADFSFTGDIVAVREGTPISSNTPLLSVRGTRTEAQLLETRLLNILNFQTMIASKANRVVQAARGAAVADFGPRRAQEADAAIFGARAAYIGGATGTSNVLAGKEFGIPIIGTHAHSFIMSFSSELEAFRAYVSTFPENSTLLIDTYDTVQGARNAAVVAKELESRGHKLGAVRLDSGDLADLSIRVRAVLDEAGLDYVRIVASNDLNEYKIDDLISRGARIDAYGVGTELITAKPVAAISGVYKLVEDGDGPKIKLTPGKRSFPGRKQVWRQSAGGVYTHDVMALEGEAVGGVPLLEPVVLGGQRVHPRRSLQDTRAYTLDSVARMPEHTLGLHAQSAYETHASAGLTDLVQTLTRQFGGQ
jgi:nicotinate phosphoribosyltransferase